MGLAQKKEDISDTNDIDLWSKRGDFWEKRVNPVPQYKARKRRIIHKPLVLSGHGIKLNIDRGSLLIKCGFTHYPQKREEYRFFPRDRQLPSRIVILDGDGAITFDALEWLSEQGVPLVQINWRGEVGCTSVSDYSANPEIVSRQLDIRNTAQGFQFAKWLIQEKIQHSCDVIKKVGGHDEYGQEILEKIDNQLQSLIKTPPTDYQYLMATEAIAAAAYFRYWYTINLKWRGLNSKPIPPEWMQVGSRIGTSKSNQFALHPMNAILNYAYGVLESEVRGIILTQGLDPTIGFMHSKFKSDRQCLVFDLMEPVRPIMDLKVLEFITSHTFAPDDFILNKNGVVRLHPQFARYVVKVVQDIPNIQTITLKNIRKMLGKK